MMEEGGGKEPDRRANFSSLFSHRFPRFPESRTFRMVPGSVQASAVASDPHMPISKAAQAAEHFLGPSCFPAIGWDRPHYRTNQRKYPHFSVFLESFFINSTESLTEGILETRVIF